MDQIVLRLTLKFHYTNIGSQTILLDKKSKLIHRSMISRSLKNALTNRYEQETTASYITDDALQAAGFRDADPETLAFVVLKPGESYTIEAAYGVRHDGSSKETEGISPGKHFLQFGVATWYYNADPNSYRAKWLSDGYLWSDNMTSVPMPFTVERNRSIAK